MMNGLTNLKKKLIDTQKEIINIIGMDSFTFKTCVLIMQDQYGLFLESSKDRMKTLEYSRTLKFMKF